VSDALKSRRAGAGSRRQSPLPLGITSGWGIENKLFTEQRFLVYGSIVGVAYAIICWGWLFASRGTLCVDFTWMWVSGAFAGSSDAVRVYDLSAFSAAWRILTGLGGCMLANSHFDYPPTFLFFLYPLGLMPYSVAFVVWMVATLLLYLAAVYVILPRPAAVIAALTPFTVLGNFLLGHNGFLTAGLIGLSLAFIERWPWVSGVFLGFLTYKPQFGILFPFALLASRNWRAVVSATAMSVTLGAAAAIAFGYQTWPLFIGSLIAREPDLSPAPGLPTPLVSIYGFLQQTGVSTRISAAVHLAVAVIITAAVCYVWGRADSSFFESGISLYRVRDGHPLRAWVRFLCLVNCCRFPG
jgi:hypothetical protein